MSRVRVRVAVSGRVQGVWFRESTRRRAEELALAGWVRNMPDGRVEALFDGEESAVERALAFVREGPPLASVSKLETLLREEVSESEPALQLAFRVRY